MPDDQTPEQNDGGKLREQLEKALKDIKAANERAEKAEAQVKIFAVKNLFGELKADPRGAKFYTGEPTKEALEEWLKGDGDVFATAPEPKTPTPGTPTPQATPSGLTPEQVAAAQAMAGVQPQPGTAPNLGDQAGKVSKLSMKSDSDMTELSKLWDGIRSQAAALYQERGY